MAKDIKEPSQSEEQEVNATPEVAEDQAEQVTPEKSEKPAPTPEHPRFQDVIRQRNEEREKNEKLESRLRELEEKIEKRQTSEGKSSDDFSPEELEALDKIRRGLGIDKIQEDFHINTRAQKLRDVKSFARRHKYPKPNEGELIAYAKERGYGENYDAAYRDMYGDDIIRIEAQKYNINPVDSEKPTGGSREFKTEADRTTIADMTPDEWAEKGPGIMSSFKKSIFGK